LNLKLNPPIQTAECCVSRIRERLKLPATVEVEALKILRAVKAAALGRHPASLAAAAIYEAASQQATPVTQKMAAEAAEITEVSVRNNIRHIRKALGRMKP
ncbi:TPA: transcription initiation factor IIB, partial [Candidatus Bathyarchaeota archaeon]|nr:transcription initiation factor IIB [Candidatus Bathyarchaeota archaeon]